MLKNSERQYGVITIIIHWLSALAVFGLFAVGYWMVDLTYYSEWYRTAPHYHKSIGLILLALTLFRLGWKFVTPSPKALSDNKYISTAVKATHSALYVLLLLIMFSGYLISTADGRGIDVFNWFTLPSLGELFPEQEDISGTVHEYAAYSIAALVLLHSLGALKHHFINKDKTIIRMVRFKPISDD